MISLHYTSHTKAYNTYYAQCDIVEQSTPLHRVIAAFVFQHATFPHPKISPCSPIP